MENTNPQETIENEQEDLTKVKAPTKPNKALIFVIIVSVLLLIASLILGYFYINAFKENKKLANEKQQLISERDKQTPTPSEDEKTLLQENNDLKNDIKDYQSKISKASAYNDFFKYLNSVIETHAGFSGWTEAEFSVGRGKAEATGDTNFVSLIDRAWHSEAVAPFTRVLDVLKAIEGGIETSLK